MFKSLILPRLETSVIKEVTNEQTSANLLIIATHPSVFHCKTLQQKLKTETDRYIYCLDEAL